MSAQPWPIRFKLVVDHVHDGDTIYGEIRADAGLRIQVVLGADGDFWGVRFYGVNAPELSTVAGQAAAAWLKQLVRPGDVLLVDSYSFDKYGRRIDGVPYLADGTDLCAALVASGNGVVYP